jgi:hypothetical protein
MPNQAVLLGSLTIPGEPAYLREARKLVVRTLADGNADVDTAVLLTSELVTNSDAPRGALLYPRCSREELKGGSWA